MPWKSNLNRREFLQRNVTTVAALELSRRLAGEGPAFEPTAAGI
jgi:hypothetical protein